MIEHLPDGFSIPPDRSGLFLHAGGVSVPILRIWDDGFAIAAAPAPRLRGRVEIRAGRRRVWTGLIVAAEVEGNELRCSFKRLSPAQEDPPADYWRGEGEAVRRT